MSESGKWFDRKFELGVPLWMLPLIVERLRGTPARLEERLRDIPREKLTAKSDKWSIQEQAGHLLDLEPIWLGRLEDLRDGVAELRVADLQNTKTHEANHNARAVNEILGEFRLLRLQLVAAIERDLDFWDGRTALHPRLKQPMSVADHAYFVAEHDDHHLAVITQLLRYSV